VGGNVISENGSSSLPAAPKPRAVRWCLIA
jgi:hypothetical protein